MSDKQTMLDEVQRILDHRRAVYGKKYMMRVTALTAEYNENNCGSGSAQKMGSARKEIVQLSKAYDSLCHAYDDAEQELAKAIEEYVTQYEEYFEAKLKGEPHEWD